MNTEQVIELARKHVKNDVPMRTSAQFCLDDAMNLADSGMADHAKRRAIKSLGYSVGVFHPDYKLATETDYDTETAHGIDCDGKGEFNHNLIR